MDQNRPHPIFQINSGPVTIARRLCRLIGPIHCAGPRSPRLAAQLRLSMQVVPIHRRGAFSTLQDRGGPWSYLAVRLLRASDENLSKPELRAKNSTASGMTGAAGGSSLKQYHRRIP
jgi:hypothetical protein